MSSAALEYTFEMGSALLAAIFQYVNILINMESISEENLKNAGEQNNQRKVDDLVYADAFLFHGTVKRGTPMRITKVGDNGIYDYRVQCEINGKTMDLGVREDEISDVDPTGETRH